MKYDRNQIVAFSFIVLSAGSAIYVSMATLNYLRFYPALSQVQSQIDTISFTSSSGTSMPTLLAQITVRNPTEYSGLRLGDVALRIIFYVQGNRSLSLFDNISTVVLGSQRAGVPLGPESTQHVIVSISLDSQHATSLASFNSAHQGQVIAEVGLRVDIDTFLDSVTGSTPFTRIQDIPLSSS